MENGNLKTFFKDIAIILSGSTLNAGKDAIPVLTYHDVSDRNSNISKNKKNFHADIALLAELGFESISLSKYIDLLSGKVNSENKKFAVITFDDGFESVYLEAKPILDQYGFVACVFVASKYIGGMNTWHAHVPMESRPMMDEQMLKDLYSAGWEIFPHTHSHPDLSSLNPELIAEEFRVCELKLGDLGIKFRKITCYPYGRFNAQVIEVLKSCRYEAAFTIEFGFNQLRVSDPFRLKRIGSAWFNDRISRRSAFCGRMDRYLRLRKFARSIVKKRGKI